MNPLIKWGTVLRCAAELRMFEIEVKSCTRFLQRTRLSPILPARSWMGQLRGQ